MCRIFTALPTLFFVSWLDRENFALALLTNMLDVKTTVTLNAAHNSFWGTLVPVVGSMITTVITDVCVLFSAGGGGVKNGNAVATYCHFPAGKSAAVVMKDAVNIPLRSEIDWFKEFIKHAFYPTAGGVSACCGHDNDSRRQHALSAGGNRAGCINLHALRRCIRPCGVGRQLAKTIALAIALPSAPKNALV